MYKDYRKPFACIPRPANKNETLITYDRFSSASKGPYHYFPPTTAILPITRRRDRTRTSRVIAAVGGIKRERSSLCQFSTELGCYISARRFDADDADLIRVFRSQYERQH